MLQRFLLKTVLYFCALVAGLFLFMPSAFATSEVSISSTGCNYLESYLSVYRNNDVDQMLRLQTFLKEQEGFDVKLSGIFDSSTMIAVRKFQIRYSEDILKPWELARPTGNVSITTRHKINDLSCGITTPLSDTEKEIIRSYDTPSTDTTEVDVVDTTVHDITDSDVPKDTSKEESSESKTEIIAPIITVDSLSEYLDTTNTKIKPDKPVNLTSTTSSGTLQNNLARNGGIVGIPIGFISQFSLPILIVLTALILVQLCFFWQVPIAHKMRWVTKRF